MTTFHRASVIGLFACLVLSPTFAAAEDRPPAPSTRPAGEPVGQLEAAKAQGRFRLAYSGHAQLATAGRCALVVRVDDACFRETNRTKLADAGDFRVEADLPPGSYYLTVSPADEKDADYWPSDRKQIHIGRNGLLYEMRSAWSKPGPFVLDRRIKGLSPGDGEIAGARAAVLKWPAVAGATRYRGMYMSGRRDHFDVAQTQFVIGAGVEAGESCFWQIWAQDAGGKLLARGDGWFLGHETDAAAVAKLKASAGTCAVGPGLGGARLGIYPLCTQVPKDPKTPTDFDQVGGTVQSEAQGFVPGILVTSVLQESAALEADLIPGDVIVAIDGARVPSEGNLGDTTAFIERLSRMKAGATVALTVRRFPRELTLRVTLAGTPVAAKPGAAQPPAPVAGQPAQAPLTAAEWSDAAPGTPIISAFKADAQAAVLQLTSQQGLAADFVTCIAELPNGGMAFGTQEGLSVWDGAEIRTYTGPAPSPQTRSMTPGNSGLPANTIQDLFCDSRGRLWVATSFGVCRIETGKGGRWRLLSNAARGPFSSRPPDQTMDVQKVFETSDGTIVLGGRESAITLIDPKTDAPCLIHRDDDMNHWVTGIAEDAKHRLWFSVQGVGVLRYDGIKVEQVKGDWVKGADAAARAAGSDAAAARALVIDGQGTVWMTNGADGLGGLHADGTTETIDPSLLPGGYVEHLRVDRKGRLCVISHEGAAVRLADADHKGDKAWQYTQLDDVRYMGPLLNASDGTWWIAGYGVSRRPELKLSAVNPRARATDRLKRAIETSYPKAPPGAQIAVAAKGVVIGVADRRLLRFDGKAWEDLSAKVGRVDVYRLFADVGGTIWVGTSGSGLIGVDPAGAIRRFNNQPNHAMSVIYCLAQTLDGALYAGTQHGVYRLRGEAWEHLESDLFQVGEMLVDRRSRVWMTEVTYGKLYVYDGKSFQEVKQQSAIGDQPLTRGTLRLDDAGRVLVDVPPRAEDKSPRRIFGWDATGEKVGSPAEVK